MQALRKKVSKIPELLKLITTDEKAALIYYEFQCLPLLRWDLIDSAFEKLAETALSYNKKAFQPFVEYFERQWIKKVCFDFIFQGFFHIILYNFQMHVTNHHFFFFYIIIGRR